MRDQFWKTVPMAEMTPQEWEALCDGCGKCCLNALEDWDTGEVVETSLACRLFCTKTAACSQYQTRFTEVPECIELTPDNVGEQDFLPSSCAYRLVWAGKDLPDWHHLRSGDRELIHTLGYSVRNKTTSETGYGLPEYENHLFDFESDPALLPSTGGAPTRRTRSDTA